MKNEGEINEIPEDSDDIFKRNMLDRYVERPNKTLPRGKYAICDELCFAQFCTFYRLDNNVNFEELINDCQPIVLSDLIIEENHENSIFYPLHHLDQSLYLTKN